MIPEYGTRKDFKLAAFQVAALPVMGDQYDFVVGRKIDTMTVRSVSRDHIVLTIGQGGTMGMPMEKSMLAVVDGRFPRHVA